MEMTGSGVAHAITPGEARELIANLDLASDLNAS
jgi:hypothetical protein